MSSNGRTSLFGGFRIRVDPWEVDYGGQTPLSVEDERPQEKVDHEVELPEGEWRAIEPPQAATLPSRVVFIDGVRRLEARLQARHGQELIYGAFGSYAVGSSTLKGSTAGFGEIRVFRTAVMGAGHCLPSPIRVHEDLVFVAESTPDTEVDGPLRHVQNRMRNAEAALARALSCEDSLVVVDGPLNFVPEPPEHALGYIKRVHEPYLPSRFLPLIATLPKGSRTPLFVIRSAKSEFSRFAWFQRLAAPSPGATELHGLVRLEAAASVGTDVARSLADKAAAGLPRIAPQRARDPRAPQNLLPIGALEQRLRARLGDGRLIRRWIETLVAEEAGYD